MFMAKRQPSSRCLLAAKGYREGILRMNRGMTLIILRRYDVELALAILLYSPTQLDPSSQLLG
ncbi:hypothetical protein WANA34_1332 [Wolbachia endosymbiont of Drosophila ananassae]|nr:hypothetical protein WANA34_1332 [Wolbachia endosymbiont of Drosophila ananassae]